MSESNMSSKETPVKTFDLRTLDYRLSKGLISEKEFREFLKSLPDEDGNFEAVEIVEAADEANFDEEPEVEPQEESTLPGDNV